MYRCKSHHVRTNDLRKVGHIQLKMTDGSRKGDHIVVYNCVSPRGVSIAMSFGCSLVWSKVNIKS